MNREKTDGKIEKDAEAVILVIKKGKFLQQNSKDLL